jgi:hypothetical protein
VFSNGGNLLHFDQQTDLQTGVFLARAEWELEGFQIPQERIAECFKGGRGIASSSRRGPPRTHPILAVKNAEEAELSLKVKVLSH